VVVWGDKVVLWWWGVEMLMWCVVNVVGVCMTLYESPLISKLVEICRFPVSSRPLPCQHWLYYLKEDCKLRLIYLGLLFIVVHQLLAREAAFWILMGR
jgi:hypothetical protein